MENQDQPGMPSLNEDVVGSAPQTFNAAQPYVAPEPTPTESPAPVAAAVPQPTQAGEPTDQAAPAEEQTAGVVKLNTEEDPNFNFPAPVPRKNATSEVNYSSPLTGEWDDLATTIALPADTAARTMNYLDTVPGGNLTGTPEDQAEWARVVGEGMGVNSLHDNLQPAASREGADFRQRIMAGDKMLSIAQPRIKDDEGPLLTGERGMLRIHAILGRGGIVQIPLWHSGFWITLKQPSEGQMLDVYQRIIDNKITMGRVTNGLAFANHSVYDNAAVVDLAWKCLYETSLKDVTTTAELGDLIKAPDLHILAWGLACVMYPRGFQYERSILDSNAVKTVTVRQNLNVGTCLWVDNSALNDWQRAHMSKRQTASMSKEELKLYQSHFVRGKSKTVTLVENLAVTMRVPTINEYLNAGQAWVDELVAAVNATFTQEDDVKKRNAMIMDRAKASSMRQYSHWIEAFDLPSIEKRMVDLEGITMTAASLSMDNQIRDRYYTVMKEYVNDCMVALIAVPQTHPDEAAEALPRFDNIIPLDPIQVFFNLLYQKIAQIQARN